jgi:hypothetical protein
LPPLAAAADAYWTPSGDEEKKTYPVIVAASASCIFNGHYLLLYTQLVDLFATFTCCCSTSLLADATWRNLLRLVLCCCVVVLVANTL